MSDVDKIMDRFNKRIQEAKEKEAEEEAKAEAQRVEKLRQSYLTRTGRKEMKP